MKVEINVILLYCSLCCCISLLPLQALYVMKVQEYNRISKESFDFLKARYATNQVSTLLAYVSYNIIHSSYFPSKHSLCISPEIYVLV